MPHRPFQVYGRFLGGYLLIAAVSCFFPAYEVGEVDVGADAGLPDGGDAGPDAAMADCWGQPLNGFVEDLSFNDAALLGSSPRHPFVSPDGLSLYYIADAPEGRVHKAVRSSRDEPFVGGTLMPAPSWMGAVDFPV